MADFGSPVAQNVNVNPSQGIQTISGLMSLQSQQLGIQHQQQGLEGQAAQVQQEQQSARQRAGIANFMASFDPTKHVGKDGTLDLDEVLTDPKLREAAGDQFPQIMQSMIQAKQGQLQAKQQLAGLNDTLRSQFSSTVGSLRTDPDVIADNPTGRKKVTQAMLNFGETGGPDAQRVADIYSPIVEHAPKGKLAQGLSVMQLQAMDASTQSGRQAPSFVGTGSQLVQDNPQAAGGAPTGNLAVSIPPGWTQYEDPVTHAQYIRNQQTGESRPIGSTYGNPGGGAAAPGAGGAPPAPVGSAAPPQYKPGEAGTIVANTQSGGERYNGLVNAAAESPARVNVLDNIIQLAPQTRTGAGSGWKAAAETAIGQTPGFQGAKDDASKYNELTKYLHQNAVRSWQAAGGTGTNAQLSSIEGANPNTTQDPKTIVDLAKFNKAGELALQAKATAHQTWMHQAGNNFANQADFESKWRQNFDPVLFQLKTWTPQEAAQHLKGLPQAQIDDLAKKQAWLKSEGVY